ncbi:MAG TPA: hypothetical protein VEJ84_23395 [Acidimicrobiales bacterium]|nr:hypothetical protein [Acidimicrobiales bacterium]
MLVIVSLLLTVVKRQLRLERPGFFSVDISRASFASVMRTCFVSGVKDKTGVRVVTSGVRRSLGRPHDRKPGRGFQGLRGAGRRAGTQVAYVRLCSGDVQPEERCE